jgi:hypothetical protein
VVVGGGVVGGGVVGGGVVGGGVVGGPAGAFLGAAAGKAAGIGLERPLHPLLPQRLGGALANKLSRLVPSKSSPAQQVVEWGALTALCTARQLVPQDPRWATPSVHPLRRQLRRQFSEAERKCLLINCWFDISPQSCECFRQQ